MAQVRRGKVAPILIAWQDYLAEKQTDIEITTFSISNRRRYFIRIGSWNKLRHPPKLPLSCWREKILAPKLRISGLIKAFAECVGCMNITVGSPIDIESDSESSVVEEELEPCQTDEEKQLCQTDKATKSVVDCHVASTPS